jgi:hypothetical protein
VDNGACILDVRTDGGVWEPHPVACAGAWDYGEPGHRYEFRVTARDHVGNAARAVAQGGVPSVTKYYVFCLITAQSKFPAQLQNAQLISNRRQVMSNSISNFSFALFWRLIVALIWSIYLSLHYTTKTDWGYSFQVLLQQPYWILQCIVGTGIGLSLGFLNILWRSKFNTKENKKYHKLVIISEGMVILIFLWTVGLFYDWIPGSIITVILPITLSIYTSFIWSTVFATIWIHSRT